MITCFFTVTFLKPTAFSICDNENDHEHYYPKNENPHKDNFWINNPFIEDVNSCAFNHWEKENLIEF